MQESWGLLIGGGGYAIAAGGGTVNACVHSANGDLYITRERKTARPRPSDCCTSPSERIKTERFGGGTR